MKQQGGVREGTGPKTAVPAGEGSKTRVTVGLGALLLEKLRRQWPGLSEADVVRGAALEAAGESALPFQQARAQFDPETTGRYTALLEYFHQAGLDVQEIGGPTAALGVRLELAYRRLAEHPEIGERVGTDKVQELLYAQKDARDRRLKDAERFPKRY